MKDDEMKHGVLIFQMKVSYAFRGGGVEACIRRLE